MNRDGLFKAIIIFENFSGVSATNPQFLFQDGHDLHWAKDALIMQQRNTFIFFLNH